MGLGVSNKNNFKNLQFKISKIYIDENEDMLSSEVLLYCSEVCVLLESTANGIHCGEHLHCNTGAIDFHQGKI